jgi:hypothetical protein
VKPNRPNTGSEKKTFAKLGGLSIVGNYVTQDQPITLPQQNVRKIAEDVFRTTTPSLIKGEKGDKGDKGDPADFPEIPKRGFFVLGSINGKIQWIATEDCE